MPQVVPGLIGVFTKPFVVNRDSIWVKYHVLVLNRVQKRCCHHHQQKTWLSITTVD